MMEHIHDASNLELLHLYLDGELDKAHEEELFRAVAEDPELRTELRQFLIFRSVFQTDSARLTPPERLKRSIMAGVETPIPLVVESGGWNVFRERVLLPLSTAVVAALLTALFFVGTKETLFETPQRNIGVDDGRAVAEHVAGDAGLKSGANASIPISTAEEAGPDRVQNPIHLAPVPVPHRYVSDVATEIDSHRSDMTIPQLVLPVELLAVSNQVKRPDPEDIPEARHIDLGVVGTSVESGGADYSVQVRSFASRSFPTQMAPSQSTPLFENVSVGALYAMSDHDRVGIEVGQESFSQVFHGTDAGRSVRYEQNPILPWVGALYRHRWDALEGLGGVGPFLQFLGGGTRVGPLGRMALGIEYSPDDRVSFLLGAESTVLLYRSEGLWYGTSKLGITYGTSITF